MSKPVHSVDISDWVEKARDNAPTYRQRQAIEIVLTAISMSDPYADVLYLKGGILMGLAYGSPRLTADIDLTANLEPTNETPDSFRAELDRLLPQAAANLGYAGLRLRVQSIKKEPRGHYPHATGPALSLKVGFADVGTASARNLENGRASEVVRIDLSFREPTKQIEILEISEGTQIRAYGLNDLVAEKFRAILQQADRDRNRRQDIYDLHHLIHTHEFSSDACIILLDTIKEKCRARDLRPDSVAMRNPNIVKRCKRDWHTLELELGELPDFETCFEAVASFYEALPWET
jgi:hypothetical protein